MSDSLVPSGLQAVDARWGGLAANGTYLLVGRAEGGRSALALQFVRGAVDSDARCLLISPRAPGELLQLASTVGLDLGDAHKTGRLRLLRIPPAESLAQRGSDGLDKAYQDFVTLVRSDRPDRVVIEDFTPLVQFDSFDRFESAFTTLAKDIGELGAALIVGLGEPANSTSRQLLDVVKRHIHASIELDADSRQLRLTKQEAAPLDADPILASSSEAPDAPASSAEAPTASPTLDAVSETTVSAPEVSTDPTPEPAQTASPVPDAAGPVLDEAPSVEEDLEPVESEGESEEDASVAEADVFALDTPEPMPFAPSEPETSGYPVKGVTAAPPADPSLQGDPEDRFGVDPESVLTHGYLVDSGAIPPPERPSVPPPAFASLGDSGSATPTDAFRASLDNSFAVRVTGTPFLVVAVRMEASAPESVYFPTVAEGLRSALRPQDRILVDENRRRAVVLLPASQADAAQDLFSGLQDHLRRALGDSAAGVLRAVGAVSVPDGQPFTSSRDLMAYAYED